MNSREVTGKDGGSKSAALLLRPTLAFFLINHLISVAMTRFKIFQKSYNSIEVQNF